VEAAATGASESAHHDEHAEHAMHADGSEDRPSDAPSHGTCECIGDCCCAPAVDRVAVQTRVETRETATFVVRTRVVVRTPSTVTRYLLPWANGPPGSLI
jgi:hypothetical protein